MAAWTASRQARSTQGERRLAVRRPHLPLRQLQLDAAVAAQRLVAVAELERLELAEAGGDEPLRRHALADEILHDGDGAGRPTAPSWS